MYLSVNCFQTRFATFTDADIEKIVEDGVPKNTQRRNIWALNTWTKWATARNNRRIYDKGGNDIPADKFNKIISRIEAMDVDSLNYWISKFIVEVRKESGEEYPPNSLLALVMGLQGHLRLVAKKAVSFLESDDYTPMRQVLDAAMKRLTKKGLGSYVKKAEALTASEIDKLWNTKQLGDFNAVVLVRTMLFFNGVHFGLRGGQEHRRLRFTSPQLTLHEPEGQTPYLQYMEDCSKTMQGGLKHRRIMQKEVVHHANTTCLERCHVRLYKKYMELSPTTGKYCIIP